MGFKATNPSTGVWHYEYALYNQNLDRSIQSFSVPVGPGVNISNIGFHAPIQQPGWANDGTFNNLGYSSTPWTVTQDTSSITWSSNSCAESERQRDSLRHAVQFPVRRRSTAAKRQCDSRLLQDRLADGGCDPGANGRRHANPTPTASPTPTATATASPSPTSTATATFTPTPTATATFTPTPTPHNFNAHALHRPVRDKSDRRQHRGRDDR